MPDFQFNLKKIREEAGITQAELSKLTGLTTGAISFLENGERKPKLETALLVADALHVTVYDLIGRTMLTHDQTHVRNSLLKARANLAKIKTLTEY